MKHDHIERKTKMIFLNKMHAGQKNYTMPSLLAVVLLFITSALLAEDDNNPIFHASFDKSITADNAAGSPEASAPKKITIEEGMSGKAIVTGIEERKNSYWCKYDAKNNLDEKEGTITFWIKPLDWNGNDLKTHLFFEAKGKDSTMIIYKFINTDKILLLLGPRTKNGHPRHSTAEFSIKNWKRNEWHFIACSWNKKNIKLYLDGELKDNKKIKEYPSSPFDSFAIGAFAPENWEKSCGKSLIDEFKIYKTAISSEKIYKEWESKSSSFPQNENHNFLIGINKTTHPPVIDGKIEAGEYTFKSTGFIDISRKSLSNWQGNYYLGYDHEYLYIGVATPIPDLFRSRIKDRDGKVYEDDSIEIFLNPKTVSDEYFHFVINSLGTLYDEKNHDPSWNIGDLHLCSKINKNTWILEMAVPFEKLNAVSPENGEKWKFNICRSFPQIGSYASISPVTAGYHNIENFSFLKFFEQSLCIDLNSLGLLSLGKFKLDLSLSNTHAAPETVNTSVNLKAADKNLLDYHKELSMNPAETVNVLLDREKLKGKGKLEINISSHKNGNLYAASLPFFTEDPLQLEYLYTLPEEKILKMRFKQLELTCQGQPYTINIKLSDRYGKKLLEKSFQKEEGGYELTLDIAALTPGNYKIAISMMTPAGNIITSISKDYTIFPSPAVWDGNTIGITDKVPSPWIPVTTSENSVSCWGREYIFKDNFLPSQICSQGKELLDSPIRLSASTNGEEMKNSQKKITWKEKNETKATFTVVGKLGAIDISSDILIEYDGFMWISLTLLCQAPTKIDKLILEIPIRKAFATLVNSGDYKLKGTGALPQNGWHKNLKKKPIFWIGNEDAGFQWFAEGLKGWHVKDVDHSLEIIPGKEKVLARINIIDTPIVLDGKRVISFGFMATPARPKPSGWRDWRPGRNLRLYYPWTKLYNYPDVKFIEDGIAKELEDYKAKKMQIFFYHAFGGISPFTPEWEYYGENWRKNPPNRGDWFDKGNRKWCLAFVCPNSSSYRDFYLGKLKEAVLKMNMTLLYFDWGQVVFCNNSDHDCGWIDWNGERCSTYNILGSRILAKRIYTMMKEHNPDSIIANHMSGEIAIPVHAFSDIMVDGENHGEDVAKEESYYSVLPLDKFRAEYMSQNWGPVPILLPQFYRSAQIFNPKRLSFWSTKEAQKPINHLRGLILVHDGFCNQITDDIWKIQDKFGRDDNVEFLPYWNNSKYVKVISPEYKDIVVSIYKRAEKVMLVPFNNTDKDVNLKLWVNSENFSFSSENPIRLIDKLNGDKFSIKDDFIEIPMNSRAFRMLVYEREK